MIKVLFILSAFLLMGFSASSNEYFVENAGIGDSVSSYDGQLQAFTNSESAFISSSVSGILDSSFCGDGVKDELEACDNTDFGGFTCSTIGFGSGSLTCDGNCNIITVACSNPPSIPTGGGGGGGANNFPQNYPLNGSTFVFYNGTLYILDPKLPLNHSVVAWYNNSGINHTISVRIVRPDSNFNITVNSTGIFELFIPQIVKSDSRMKLLIPAVIIVGLSVFLTWEYKRKQKKNESEEEDEDELDVLNP